MGRVQELFHELRPEDAGRPAAHIDGRRDTVSQLAAPNTQLLGHFVNDLRLPPVHPGEGGKIAIPAFRPAERDVQVQAQPAGHGTDTAYTSTPLTSSAVPSVSIPRYPVTEPDSGMEIALKRLAFRSAR